MTPASTRCDIWQRTADARLFGILVKQREFVESGQFVVGDLGHGSDITGASLGVRPRL